MVTRLYNFKAPNYHVDVTSTAASWVLKDVKLTTQSYSVKWFTPLAKDVFFSVRIK